MRSGQGEALLEAPLLAGSPLLPSRTVQHRTKKTQQIKWVPTVPTNGAVGKLKANHHPQRGTKATTLLLQQTRQCASENAKRLKR